MVTMIASALVGAAVVGVLHVLGSEVRGRAPRILRATVRFAVRRLPEDLRDEFADEWMAEVVSILTESKGLPATRAWSALTYGVDLFRSTRAVGEALGGGRQQRLVRSRVDDYHKLFGSDVLIFPGGHWFVARHVKTGAQLSLPATPADPGRVMRAAARWLAEQNAIGEHDADKD